MLVVRLVLLAVLFGVSQLLLRRFGLDVLAHILLVGFGILGGSYFFTYAILGTFVIEPSRESDEQLRSSRIIHDAAMANQRNQGLVLDMDAYYDGKERYISTQEAELQKTLGHKFRKFVKDLKS